MTPWPGDAVGLVDAFRRGERSPVDELAATLAAIERSDLNAFSHLDADAALERASQVDLSAPFGGVPLPVKAGTSVASWPFDEASVPLAGRTAEIDSTVVARLRASGAVLFGQTTMSEFAGLHQTWTRLHGATRNPWDPTRTPGGSSGGAAAAVAGGIVPIATGGDGGGSIRIPAAFCGLPGLKCTYGRLPKGPRQSPGNHTSVSGCLSRSVRDIARYLDVTNGFDPRDPSSLDRVDGYEAGLGTHLDELRGLRVAYSPTLGTAVVHPRVVELLDAHAELLIGDLSLERIDRAIVAPEGSFEWALGGMVGIRSELGDLWPDCAPELTPAIRFGLELAEQRFGLDAARRIEEQRTEHTERMAAIFDEVDLVISATTPDVAFGATGPLPSAVDGVDVPMGNNGALTIPANFYGNPSISIPIGTIDGLPVGMQVMARHRREDLLLDLAHVVERERPWPLTAPPARRR